MSSVVLPVKDSKNPSRDRKRSSRKEKSESDNFIEKIVHVNRVAKVVKGGRRFSFSVLVVVGDGRGKVGYGTGKAKEVPDAVIKAVAEAKRNMVRVPMREGRTLHHDITSKAGAGMVIMRSAPSGTGVIAGGAMRAVFEAVGIQDVVAKSFNSSNPYNLVRATFSGLQKTCSPKYIATKRGKKTNEIVAMRDHASKEKSEIDAAHQG